MVNSNTSLELIDVFKDFNGVRAGNGVSLQVNSGTITGLIGPNGAGKTTLFDLITGFLTCNRGRIFLEGERIDRLSAHQIARSGIARTFQIPRELSKMTVLENLMLVPKGQIGESLWKAWLLPWKVNRQENGILSKSIEILKFTNLFGLRNEYAGNLSTGQKNSWNLHEY